MMAGIALAIWVIVRVGSFGMVMQRWHTISGVTLGTTGTVLALAIGARAARFSTLLGTRRTVALWGSTAGYSFACVLLPGGIGELTLPFYLKPFGVTVPEALAVAMITRLADIIISIMFVLPQLSSLTGASKTAVLAVGVITVTLMAVTVMVYTYRDSVRRRLAVLTVPYWHQIEQVLVPMMEAVRSISWQQFWRLALCTIAWKLLNAVMYWRLAQSLHMGIRFLQVFNALIMYSLLMILPVPSVAGFGTSEAGWIVALRSQGTGLSQAALAGLTFHVGNLVLLALFGGLPMLRLFRRTEPHLANHLRVAHFGKKRQRRGDVS